VIEYTALTSRRIEQEPIMGMSDTVRYPYFRIVVRFLPKTKRAYSHSYAPIADYSTEDGMLQFRYQDDKRITSIPITNILEVDVHIVEDKEDEPTCPV
jgi:hypothetical protein